ncbi:hypothetical protein DY000_02030824 [Brassica cretica]|uniref:DUF4005 domain-containing protein n=1 Tax=Brassica cretica TaxID=69181 RepID=A0ABQ7DJK7_BRACR|nr:hypothetical protein DY000_02030824 [Brassica cretica]
MREQEIRRERRKAKPIKKEPLGKSISYIEGSKIFRIRRESVSEIEIPNSIRASIRTRSYATSSSGNIRALGSTVSKTSSEAQSSPSSMRISGQNSTRPRSDVRETDHPPGSEYGSGLSGTRDNGITGAMYCLREAC